MRAKTLATRMLNMLALLVALVFALLLCLPVILLPFSTAVPAWAWIPMAAADVILLILFARIKPAYRKAIPLGGMLLVAAIAIFASQRFATTPPILDEQGKPVAGSISSLEQMTLNGSRQWVSIRGEDAAKPVLLFLAGGPGGTQLATARFALAGLEEHFVVVDWDQPGSGKSLDAVDRSTLTPERYIEDAHSLVLQLRQRFGQEKVYVVGESWGSALGILLVQRYPELFHAFAGTGQMVAFLETDRTCYDWSLQWARERGDTTKVEKLIEQGPPPYYGRRVAWKQATYLMDTFRFMNQNPAIADNDANTLRDLAGVEYGLYDKVSWFRGVLGTLGIVYPQLWEVDFRTQATQLQVPVYFLIGRHDINAPVALTQEYFDLLDAPHKQIVWFEHSGHTPWVSEPDAFVRAMVEVVLAQTQEP
ncbi:MAG TPA: alpha/beta hydrolase [Anaerolineae bacterium]|nr:alpha/beta hydrolase [Anaerolineae bacterium]